MNVCDQVRRLGYQTVQLWDELCSINPARAACSLELISCDDGCLRHHTKGSRQACISGLELRTGWDASLECRCNNSRGFVNCAETAPHIELPSRAIVPRPTSATRRPGFVEGQYERVWGAAAWLRMLPSCVPGCSRDKLDWEINMQRCRPEHTDCERAARSRAPVMGGTGTSARPLVSHYSAC